MIAHHTTIEEFHSVINKGVTSLLMFFLHWLDHNRGNFRWCLSMPLDS